MFLDILTSRWMAYLHAPILYTFLRLGGIAAWPAFGIAMTVVIIVASYAAHVLKIVIEAFDANNRPNRV